MEKEAEPVFVVLPDASIRIYDRQRESRLTAGEVIREHPGHTLGRVPDSRRSQLSPDTPLRPGSTYYLARAIIPQATPRNPIPVVVLPSGPAGSAAAHPSRAATCAWGSAIPPPSPANTNPMSWRSSSIGSESSCSEMNSAMDLNSAPPHYIGDDDSACALSGLAGTPGRQAALDSVQKSPHNSGSPGGTSPAPLGARPRKLRVSLSEKEQRCGGGNWSASPSPGPGSQGATPVSCRIPRNPLRAEALAAHLDESCQIVLPMALTHLQAGMGPAHGWEASSGLLPVPLPSPHSRSKQHRRWGVPPQPQGVPSPRNSATCVVSHPRDKQPPLLRVESCTIPPAFNPILMELEELEEDPLGQPGARQRKLSNTLCHQALASAEGKVSVKAKLGAALDKMGIRRGLGKGKSGEGGGVVQERLGLRRAFGMGRRVLRSRTEVLERSEEDLDEAEIEFHDSAEVHQGWNRDPGNSMYFSSPFQKTDFQADAVHPRQHLRAEWH